VCCLMPIYKSSFCSRRQCSFIVDLNKLTSSNDITCDDMGVWKWGGSRKRWVSVDEGGSVSFLDGNYSENC